MIEYMPSTGFWDTTPSNYVSTCFQSESKNICYGNAFFEHLVYYRWLKRTNNCSPNIYHLFFCRTVFSDRAAGYFDRGKRQVIEMLQLQPCTVVPMFMAINNNSLLWLHPETFQESPPHMYSNFGKETWQHKFPNLWSFHDSQISSLL